MFFNRILSLITLLVLTSCLPKEPSKDIVSKKTSLNEDIEIVKFNNLAKVKTHKSAHWKYQNTFRNAIFVALDETVQTSFQPLIQNLYKTENEVRIEDISWWRFAPDFKGMYDRVIKISHKGFHKNSLIKSIEIAESYNQPYDLYILTHGIPNHLTSTKGNPLISYDDIASLDGIVQNLELVYLQSCFGTTLSSDFLKIGAREVIAFEGFNRNFFYIDFFIKEFKKQHYNGEKAFSRLNKTLEKKMKKSFLYQKVLTYLEMEHEEYINTFSHPKYFD